MNLNIKTLNCFDKDVKRLFKKYKQLLSDLKILKQELFKNPRAGIQLGNLCYKIRLANSSISTGKSELENINDKIILQILKENGLL